MGSGNNISSCQIVAFPPDPPELKYIYIYVKKTLGKPTTFMRIYLVMHDAKNKTPARMQSSPVYDDISTPTALALRSSAIVTSWGKLTLYLSSGVLWGKWPLLWEPNICLPISCGCLEQMAVA